MSAVMQQEDRPEEPAEASADPGYKWRALVVVMLGTLMAALDTSIVNVSIPSIMADFGASLDNVEWVVTGYMLAFSTLMPLTSWLSNRIGHKQLYVFSLAVFTLGSVMCGMAWNTPTLVGARVIQAIGGGAIMPTSMAIISDVFEPHERGRAMGYWGVGVIIGPAFGPTLGGYLTAYFGWPSIFFVNLPIGIVGVWAALTLLRQDKPHPDTHKPFDFWGFGFLSVFLITFLYAVSRGEHDGWYSPLIVSFFITSALSFIGFLLVETHVKHGIMDLKLFKIPVFTVAMMLTATRSVALFGGVFLLPVYLQQLKGLDEIDTGLLMLPGSLIIAFFMPVAGILSERIGPRYLTLFGLLGMLMFLYMYHGITANTSNWDVIFPTLLRGIAMPFLMAPLMATTLNAVPRQSAAMVSSMSNLMMQIAGALGIAILAMVLSHRTHFHVDIVGNSVNAHSPVFQSTVHNVMDRAKTLGYDDRTAAAAAQAAVAKAGYVRASELGFQDAFIFGALIVLLTIPPVFLLPRKPPAKPDSPMVME